MGNSVTKGVGDFVSLGVGDGEGEFVGHRLGLWVAAVGKLKGE